MRILALPVKSLDGSKRRLSPVLTPMERAAVSLAMYEDILDVALAVPGWETVVISPDQAVLEIAATRGAHALPEERPTLTHAVRQVEQDSIDRGAEQLAVLVADAALVTAPLLIDALRTLAPVVLAGGEDGGTTLLVRRPVRVIAARFGHDSFSRHQELATTKEVPTALVHTPGMCFDLDVPNDIPTFLGAGKPGRTRDVLLQMGAATRMAARA